MEFQEMFARKLEQGIITIVPARIVDICACFPWINQ